MSMSHFFSLALLVVVARASPVLNRPSRVSHCDPPAPSGYPLDKACGHEWQYLNFDPKDDTDKAHLQKLHVVICDGEMRALASYGQYSAQNVFASYTRYFPKSDEQDDFETHVKDVLGRIAGTSSTDGAIGAIVSTFVVDNLDFAIENPGADDCTGEGTLAYTLTDQLDSLEKIHFCDPSWTRGSVPDVDCASLDPFPSTKMDSFSRIVLHEMTHYSSVGPETSLGLQIKDVRNADGTPAYNPSRAHGLLAPDQDDNPAVTEINADSYAWMSVDAWVSRLCEADFVGFQRYD